MAACPISPRAEHRHGIPIAPQQPGIPLIRDRRIGTMTRTDIKPLVAAMRSRSAPRLFTADLNPKVIQARLGHVAISETMDTYGNACSDSEDLGHGSSMQRSVPLKRNTGGHPRHRPAPAERADVGPLGVLAARAAGHVGRCRGRQRLR
jgi:hypothetical protein